VFSIIAIIDPSLNTKYVIRATPVVAQKLERSAAQ